ncbi:MAG: hypothetical protein U0228_00535 [Myxococcaceae bacterium]
MKRSSWELAGALALAVAAVGCGKPNVGDACSNTDTVVCKSTSEVFACVSGKWAAVACQGARGCTDATVLDCDNSLATANTPCPPWADGRTACQALPPALVTCVGGRWSQTNTCGTCVVNNGAPSCMSSNTGGGGGTTGGGGGTTGGGGATGGGGGTGGGTGSCDATSCPNGCCANGQCFSPPLNGTTNFCGTGGVACDDCGARGQVCNANFTCSVSTSCNPTSCPNGCCANGQCFIPPLNQSLNFCGTGGNTCADCGRLGLVCGAGFFCTTSGTGGGGGATGGGGGATGGGAATGGGGATGGGTGGGGVDPCMGVPVGGTCLSSSLVQYCSIPTGTGNPSVQTYQCPGGSTCQPTGAGASCVQTGSCVADDKRCASATNIQTCTQSGTWGSATSCGGGAACVGTPLGAGCALTSVPTTTVTHRLMYQSKKPNAQLTDWAAPTALPARNVTVLSQRGQSLIDATATDANGNFTIKVPTTPGATDSVVFAAYSGDGLGMRFAVADPGLGSGTFSPGQTGSNPRYWSWSKTVAQVPTGGTTTIATTEGSGALNIYDLLQAIWNSSKVNNQGQEGLTIGMWMGIGTEWSCGACFSQDNNFASGIWMPGAAQDEGYWSDYTIAHELGHWEMESYGTSPNEGGTHILMCPTFPGQAWSEGYATWHSAAVRNQPFLEDKQQGSFFWFDISSRTYFPQSSQPSPIDGPGGTNLQAQMDENAVSAVLWHISNSRQSGAREIFNAIGSKHMNTSPWPRGYTRRTWSVGNNCTKTNVVNTNQPSLFIADVLDTLSCGGSPAQSNRMPASTILAACSSPTSAANGSYYPYPTTTPSCRSGFCYGCLTGSTCNAGNVATACGTGGVACVQCGNGQSCVNGVCL